MAWFPDYESHADQQTALLIGHLKCKRWPAAATIRIRYINSSGLVADQTFVEASSPTLYLTIRDCRPIPCHPPRIKHGWLVLPFAEEVDLATIFRPKRSTSVYIPQVAERPWRPAMRTMIEPEGLTSAASAR